MLSSDADIIIIDPEREYAPLVKALGGEVIEISPSSTNHINAMDLSRDYGETDPIIDKSQFLQSLCEQIIAGHKFSKGQQSIIDRCTELVYRYYKQGNYQGTPPTLQDFREVLLNQEEEEAHSLALELELFTRGSLNTFAKQTNVNTNNRLICFDILELGEQLRAIGMLVILDNIINRITANRLKGRETFIYIDEIYLLFMHEYSAQFLFKLWKRVRKYGAFCTVIP
jgi:type IV secretory pathway VirB4 component